MFSKTTLAAVLALGAALALSAPAKATTFDFNYSDGVVVHSGFGQFFATEEGVTNVYDVTGITGFADGAAIIGLSGYAGADNKLYFPGSVPPNSTKVDFSGISFFTLLDAWGIGAANNGSSYGLAQQSTNPNGECCGFNPLTFNVSEATPIPGAVFLFGSVLAGGVGGMRLRRWRSKTRTGAAA